MAAPKAIKANVKFRLQAGKATPAPPVGSILGGQGVNMMEFINAFNDQTKDMGGQLVAVKVTVYEDRSFDFKLKGQPVAHLIRQAAGVDKGSGTPNKTKVAKLSLSQVHDIAETKMADLNAHDIDAAARMVAGTARSMGIEVE